VSKDEILKLSDTELDKMDRALSLQLTALQVQEETGADDVRGDAGASDRTGRAV
jgi:ribosomal protein L29